MIVSYEDGMKKAEEIGAIKYIECCVWKTNDIDKLKATLSAAVIEYVLKKRKSDQNCCCM